MTGITRRALLQGTAAVAVASVVPAPMRQLKPVHAMSQMSPDRLQDCLVALKYNTGELYPYQIKMLKHLQA